jgi:ABC-type transport system involved in cytochrome c biogenesis permease subunit
MQTVCFMASYALALCFELVHQLRPRAVFRFLGLAFGAAGILAQTIFLLIKRPPLAWQYGWLLFLGWILAIFYLAGSLHHRRQAWGVFVLPLVLALLGFGIAFGPPGEDKAATASPRSLQDVWGPLHGILIFAAAIGVCVGFLASLMYLLQSHRLRAKTLPGKG